MSNSRRPFAAPTHDPATFAHNLRKALAPHRRLLDGLIELREIGSDGEEAVERILDLPDLRRVRLSWELWDMLVIGDGHEPDDLLAVHIRPDHLDEARLALWGRLPTFAELN